MKTPISITTIWCKMIIANTPSAIWKWMLVEGLINNFFLMVSMFSGSLQCHVEHCQRQMMQDNMNPWVDPHGQCPGSAFAKNVGGLTYWREEIDVHYDLNICSTVQAIVCAAPSWPVNDGLFCRRLRRRWCMECKRDGALRYSAAIAATSTGSMLPINSGTTSSPAHLQKHPKTPEWIPESEIPALALD
jgi:hypothetical protein